MAKLTPYLFFNGNCREAMTFYKECLGGELQMQTVGESPMAEQMPDSKENILHSVLTAGKLVLMASDWMSTGKSEPGTNVDLCIEGETKGEIEDLFTKLGEGGQVTMPLKEEFFGTMGGLTDKFGVHWLFEFSSDKTT